MKINSIFLFLVLVTSCNKAQESSNDVFSEKRTIHINENGLMVRERFIPPKAYVWIQEEKSSFGEFLINFQLKPYGSKIYKYDGTLVSNQNIHEAVLDIDVGDKDLQQCADSFIRLHAEYLLKTKQEDKIGYHFTSGHYFKWKDYENGTRAFVSGNNVAFKKVKDFDGSYGNFRNYLNVIYNYAGTISQNKETKKIEETKDLKVGDLLITPGSPGHIIFIIGAAENNKGEKVFLLAEGFTPAQSIIVMKNLENNNLSPWYKLDAKSKEIKTARYDFKNATFRRYE